MVQNPWQGRPVGSASPWFDNAELQRFNAWNAKAPPKQKILTSLPSGPVIPCAWGGDPWNADVILLLKNPAFNPTKANSPGYELNDPITRRLLEEMATGNFDPVYPNAGLNPQFLKNKNRQPTRGKALQNWTPRVPEPWYTNIVWTDVHKELVKLGMNATDAWQRIAQRGCTLDISPWGSQSWHHSCMSQVSHDVCVPLAREAIKAGKIVLIAWGADIWQIAGLFEAVNLPVSQTPGVRHTPRISKTNFPTHWQTVINAMK